MRPIEVTGFEIVEEGYEHDPNEVVEQTEMGNIAKIVFASGKIEYHIFDSQVGSSRVSIVDGEKAEKAFNLRHVKRMGSVAMCLDI